MKNWLEFISFGFCLGCAFSSFIYQEWGVALIQFSIALICLPIMLQGGENNG